jgi:hypothetical protein
MFFYDINIWGIPAKILPLLIKNGGGAGTTIHVKNVYLINDSDWCLENASDVPSDMWSHLWYFKFFHHSYNAGDGVFIPEAPTYDNVSQTYAFVDYPVPYPYSWNVGAPNSMTGSNWTSQFFSIRTQFPFDLAKDTNDFLKVHVAVAPFSNTLGAGSSQFPEGGQVQGEHTATLYIEWGYSPDTVVNTNQYKFKVKINASGIIEMDRTDWEDIETVDFQNTYNIIEINS